MNGEWWTAGKKQEKKETRCVGLGGGARQIDFRGETLASDSSSTHLRRDGVTRWVGVWRWLQQDRERERKREKLDSGGAVGVGGGRRGVLGGKQSNVGVESGNGMQRFSDSGQDDACTKSVKKETTLPFSPFF